MPGIILPSSSRDPRDPREDLDYAISHHPRELQITRMDDLAADWRRAPRDRQGNPMGHGGVRLELPDEMVRNLRGPESDRDLVVLIRIPNNVLRARRGRVVIAR
jgi:hypothetical protein